MAALLAPYPLLRKLSLSYGDVYIRVENSSACRQLFVVWQPLCVTILTTDSLGQDVKITANVPL